MNTIPVYGLKVTFLGFISQYAISVTSSLFYHR